MINLLGAIGPIAKIALGVVDKSVGDKDLKEKLKAEISQQLLTNEKIPSDILRSKNGWDRKPRNQGLDEQTDRQRSSLTTAGTDRGRSSF